MIVLTDEKKESGKSPTPSPDKSTQNDKIYF